MSLTSEVSTTRSQDRGQVTIALAGVLVLAALFTIGLALVGQAMIHRAASRTAADSVALAAAVDPMAASEIAEWYHDRGIAVTQSGGRTLASVGEAQAASWAEVTTGANMHTPALVAIVARANQLLDIAIEPRRWDTFSIAIAPADASAFRSVASELGLCEDAVSATTATSYVFKLC